jgi:osmoprotectant transport system ATP-binding protein
MIAVENLSKSFGQTLAIDDISFDVKEGENLVILGTSGCGKTTTLRMINRLEEPDSGKISIHGESIYDQPAENLRRNIGYVLQHNALFPHYTVAENIAIVPRLLKWDKQKIKSRTEELLEKLKLSPSAHMHAYPHQLSGGQQQRVNVARALAADPPVLLMDEPFGALDPVTRSNIVKEFSELDELKKKTIIMVTHDVQEAFELGNRICIMDKGKIMQIGTPPEVLFHPSNTYVQQFLEKQQMGLAFKLVTLKDIWHLIPDIDKKEFNLPGISSSSSIWEVMEILMKTGKTDPAENEVKETYVHEKKQLTLSEILTAYILYRNGNQLTMINNQ